ncbi:MAG: SIMPL domain-containing protein [Alphaproteobacteria bacterium]|nr:SIMPL domain-containing protein [Alphaproteobacteria bacterium]
MLTARTARLFAAGTCLLALFAASPALAEEPRVAIMALDGTATVKAEPDMATVTTGVTTAALTAREALDANNAAMSNLLDLIKSSGVADKDMQTSGFSVQPQYVYSDKTDENGYRLPPRIVGYEVSNTLTVMIRDLGGLGAVLDEMVSAGSNTIGGVSFAVSDNTELRNQARRDAVTAALDKAELYADAAGVCLDRIVSIRENGGYLPEPNMMRAYDMVAEAAPSVPVASGEVGYSMTVSVEWELGDCD